MQNNNIKDNIKNNTNKNKTCNVCENRHKCKELCESMILKLKNIKNINDIYSESTMNNYNKTISDIEGLSSILYSHGLSSIENRDIKRIVIAMLTKEQKKIIDLYSQGYTQREIAKTLKVSQSNISQRIDSIKSELKKSLIEIIPYIVEK